MIRRDLLELYGGHVKKYFEGEIIFNEGGRCNFYFQLEHGLVRWVNIMEDGKEYLHTMVEENESFGELPLFDGGVYAATSIAHSDCDVYRLPIKAFNTLIEEHSDIHLSFLRLLAEQLRFKFVIIKELAIQNPSHRISAILAILKATKKNICQNCQQIKLTRQQLADMTGLRVETVIREMRKMHKNGDIVIKNGRVYLPDIIEFKFK